MGVNSSDVVDAERFAMPEDTWAHRKAGATQKSVKLLARIAEIRSLVNKEKKAHVGIRVQWV